MRIACVLFLSLFVVTAEAATAKTPAEIVIKYECGQIPKDAGFTCQNKKRKYDSGFAIVWHELPSNMSPTRKERALYEFNKIALRIVNLGIKSFYLRVPNQADDMIKSCKSIKSGFTFTCNWLKCEDYPHGGSHCKKY